MITKYSNVIACNVLHICNYKALIEFKKILREELRVISQGKLTVFAINRIYYNTSASNIQLELQHTRVVM